jgi:hypothetical protein
MEFKWNRSGKGTKTWSNKKTSLGGWRNNRNFFVFINVLAACQPYLFPHFIHNCMQFRPKYHSSSDRQ